MAETYETNGTNKMTSKDPDNTQNETKDGKRPITMQKGSETGGSGVGANTAGSAKAAGNIDFLLDIPLEITIELDRTTMLINEMLKLGQGSIIELSKFAGETLDVLANQRLIAKGEVVVINDKYGIRLTEIISPMERLVRLK